MKILSVVGARPNFMKIAPFIKAIENYNTKLITLSSELIEHVLVHTDQHYDHRMSQTFFDDFDLPQADINLGIGSGTHAEQIGQTMIAFEKVLRTEKPDWVVVVGDVNATLACSVTSKKECIKVCHIEAGLRSGDLTMPEEINRLVTDRISDLLLVPDRLSVENLKTEGVPESKIRFVGNIMIDTLEANRFKASRLDINEIIIRNLLNTHLSPLTSQRLTISTGRVTDRFGLITIHRPSNVDIKNVFEPIVRLLIDEVAKELNLIWPIHPRTKKQLVEFGLYEEVMNQKNIILLEPLGYIDMLRLNMGARIMLTDSGGLQEECTVLGTPCLTLRWNTERPVTLKEHGGANVLVGNNIDKISTEFHSAMDHPRNPLRPELWDGHTAERCLKAILEYEG
jgi:UDP-N-acetylglucosamine 2-epimerase (non-hydrolysing)